MSGWLVTGAAGMLGRDLTALLAERGEQVTGLGRSDLDITDPDAVAATLDKHQPSVVVNCAAWTAVDDAETHASDALRVNGDGPANLAAACARLGAVLIQPSTDYVFDGQATRPYRENDTAQPRSSYGRTKLAGERAVLETLPDSGYVLRTAWLYGQHGPNFVATMLRLARTGNPVTVVNDQAGQPTWTADLAAQAVTLVAAGAPAGIYHATTPARPPGSAWPRRSSTCMPPARDKAPAGSLCGPRPVPLTPAPRPSRSPQGRPTACLATTHGPRRGLPRSATGATRCCAPTRLSRHRPYRPAIPARLALCAKHVHVGEAVLIARQLPRVESLAQRRGAGVLSR